MSRNPQSAPAGIHDHYAACWAAEGPCREACTTSVLTSLQLAPSRPPRTPPSNQKRPVLLRDSAAVRRRAGRRGRHRSSPGCWDREGLAVCSFPRPTSPRASSTALDPRRFVGSPSAAPPPVDTHPATSRRQSHRRLSIAASPLRDLGWSRLSLDQLTGLRLRLCAVTNRPIDG